jgi:hypothetical protein
MRVFSALSECELRPKRFKGVSFSSYLLTDGDNGRRREKVKVAQCQAPRHEGCDDQ